MVVTAFAEGRRARVSRMARFDAEVWFRFSSQSVSTAGADVERSGHLFRLVG